MSLTISLYDYVDLHQIFKWKNIFQSQIQMQEFNKSNHL